MTEHVAGDKIRYTGCKIKKQIVLFGRFKQAFFYISFLPTEIEFQERTQEKSVLKLMQSKKYCGKGNILSVA